MYRPDNFLKNLLLLALLALITTTSVYGISVVSTSPSQNANNVTPATSISVTFDDALDTLTVSIQSFVANGSLTGLNSGTIVFDSTEMTATLTPNSPFAEGEKVTVVLTTAITNQSATPLASGFVWTFTTSVSSGNGSFLFDSTYSIDTLPHCVYAGDFDNDNDFDLAAIHFRSGLLSVLLNDGSGTFGAADEYDVGDSVRYVFGGDFDKDGYMDLAVGNGGSDDISVLLNNGDGTFASQVVYSAGNGPHSVFCADLNGDGSIDIACGDAFGNTVSILLNNGDGTFATASSYVTANHPRSVYAADLDNDGDLDIATANLNSGSTSILMNNGDGTFAPKVDYSVGAGPRLIFSADLNSDSYMDLVAANSGSDNVAVLLNDGDGTFATAVPYSVLAADPYALNASDFSNNGILDIVSANTIENSFTYFQNNGSGNLSVSGQFAGSGDGPLSLAVADFNADGAIDIASSDFFGASITVFFNNGPVVSTNSLLIPSLSIFPCENTCEAIQPVQVDLVEPIKGATIPIEVPAGFEICSLSTAGLITETWDIVILDYDDWDDSGYVFVLLANTFGDLIPVGISTVFDIYYNAKSLCNESYFVHWDTALSWDPSRQLKFADTSNMVIFPDFSSANDSTEIEGYLPGDFNSDGMVNIIDLTAFVDRVFRGGEPACQLNSADNNGDCGGPDIADLTYLVDYIFRSGAFPKCGCL